MGIIANRHRMIANQSPDYKTVFQNGTIMSSGKWQMDGSRHESWLVKIAPGSVVDTMSGTGHSCYAFLTDVQGITNGSTAHFAGGTSMLYAASNIHNVYTAPADAHYLQIRKKVSGEENSVHPQWITINGTPLSMQSNWIITTWNQLAPAIEAGNWEPYSSGRISVSFSDGIATITNLQSGAGDGQMMWNTTGFRRGAGEKVYVGVMMCPTWYTKFVAELLGPGDRDYPAIAEANTWARYGKIALEATSDQNGCRLCIPELNWGYPASVGDSEQIKCPVVINLTTMFGAGNEPTTEQFEQQCLLNGVDLESPIPYNTGMTRYWRIN